jgi:hypothetical protein
VTARRDGVPPLAAQPLETPVAFFVFNRPELTRRVFEAIAAARPKRLLLVADGPRHDRAGEAERCAAVRAIVSRVDWECVVQRAFAESNLGCRQRVSTGLDWVFTECERAIILEDDCLPHPTFFRYAEELLDRYASDERVTMIGGSGFDPARPAGASYRFSRYNLIWGWASWRRAWRRYDVAIRRWPEFRSEEWLLKFTGEPGIAAYWREVFDRVHAGEIDTWDYQWTFASWAGDGLAIHPHVNLVSNIGFGADATHTLGDSHLAARAATAMAFPMVHPASVVADAEADRVLAREVYQWVREARSTTLVRRLRSAAGRLVRASARAIRKSPPAADRPPRPAAADRAEG